MAAPSLSPSARSGTIDTLLRVAGTAIAALGAIAGAGEHAHAATPQLPEFVLVSNCCSTVPYAVYRFDIAGQPDPAPAYPGTAILVPDKSRLAAWGPDGNLYRMDSTTGAVDQVVPSTGAVTPFAAGGSGRIDLAFGPDGNLYVLAGGATMTLYAGPLNPWTSPGTSIGTFPGVLGTKLVFGPDGNLYTTNRSTKVYRYTGPLHTSSCFYQFEFEPCGSGNNHADPTFLDIPGAVFSAAAFGPDGNLYIVDESSGTLVRYGGGPHNFSSSPEGSELPATGQVGAIYVAHYAGNWVPSIGAWIDFGPDGNLYVLQDSNVFRFFGPYCSPAQTCQGTADSANPNDATLTSVSGELFSRLAFYHPSAPKPGVITPSPAAPRLFVSDTGANSVLRYIDVSFAADPLPVLAGADFVPTGSQGLSNPQGLALDSSNRLYVASAGTSSILRFDALTGAPAPAPGLSNADFAFTGFQGLSLPTGIVIGPDGLLYVANQNGDDVLRFGTDGASDGAPAPAFNRSGAEFVAAGEGGLIKPTALAFGPDGHLYVAALGPDPSNGSVLRFNGQYGYFMNVVRGSLSNPHGVVLDGSLIVANVENDNALVQLPGYPYYKYVQSGAIAKFSFTSGSIGLKNLVAYVPDTPIFPTGPGSLAISRDGLILATAAMAPNVIWDEDGPIYLDGLDQASFLISGDPGAGVLSISGKVYIDSVAASNVIAGATVWATREVMPNLFSCPTNGLIFFPCPSATTDAANDHLYTLPGLAVGSFIVTAAPDSQHSSYLANSVLVTIPASATGTISAPDIVLKLPAPIPAGTTVAPATMVPVTGGETPAVNWNSGFTITTQACAGGAGYFSLVDNRGGTIAPTPAIPGTMSEGPPGTYTGTVPALNPFKGAVTVTTTVLCKPSTLDTTAFTLYIDPSGTVVDGATQLPVPGATVTLLRSSTANGSFVPVPNGDAIMALSNRNNPDLTNAYGDYGWDVIPGFYKLRASAPGYICNPNPMQSLACVDDATVETPVFAIPPAVTGLTITIFRDEVFDGNFDGGP